jgi:hypothetical protein
MIFKCLQRHAFLRVAKLTFGVRMVGRNFWEPRLESCLS